MAVNSRSARGGRPGHVARPTPRRGPGASAVIGGMALAAAAVVVLVVIVQTMLASAPAGDSPPKVKGRADAPVTVEEWGDFQ